MACKVIFVKLFKSCKRMWSKGQPWSPGKVAAELSREMSCTENLSPNVAVHQYALNAYYFSNYSWFFDFEQGKIMGDESRLRNLSVHCATSCTVGFSANFWSEVFVRSVYVNQISQVAIYFCKQTAQAWETAAQEEKRRHEAHQGDEKGGRTAHRVSWDDHMRTFQFFIKSLDYNAFIASSQRFHKNIYQKTCLTVQHPEEHQHPEEGRVHLPHKAGAGCRCGWADFPWRTPRCRVASRRANTN